MAQGEQGAHPRAAVIAAFFVIACLWSFAFAGLPLPPRIGGFRIDDSIVVGWGPAVGAIALAVYAGTLPALRARIAAMASAIGFAALALPVVSVTLVGLKASAAPQLAGLVFALSVTL